LKLLQLVLGCQLGLQAAYTLNKLHLPKLSIHKLLLKVKQHIIQLNRLGLNIHIFLEGHHPFSQIYSCFGATQYGSHFPKHFDIPVRIV